VPALERVAWQSEAERKAIQILGMVFVPFGMWGAIALVLLILIDTVHLLGTRRIPIWRDLRALGEQGAGRDHGPILLALGGAVVLFIVPQPWSWGICSMAFVGDGMAAVIGKAVGGPYTPFKPDKTIAGALSCAVTIAAVSFIAGIPCFSSLLLAATGMCVEYLSPSGTDNVLLPLSGIGVWAVMG